MERTARVYDLAMHSWYFLGSSAKTLHQQAEAMKEHNPVRKVQVLRALAALNCWTPAPLDDAMLATPLDASVPLPQAPPHVLTPEQISDAYKLAVFKVHPDRNRDDPLAATRAQDVNAARDLVGQFFESRLGND